MKKHVFIYFFVVWVLFSELMGQDTALPPYEISLENKIIYPLADWKFKAGDQLEWADPAYNDSLWQQSKDIKKKNTELPVVWFRKKFEISGSVDQTDMPIITAIQLAKAFQVYWDGQLIGTNGDPDTIPPQYGDMIKSCIIPQNLLEPGEHLLAVRVNNDFQKIYKRYRIYFTFENNMKNIRGKTIPVYHFKNGFELLAIMLSLALFIGTRHTSYFFFGMHRIGYGIFTLYIYLLYSYPISMKYNDLIMGFVQVFDPLSYVFLGLFVLYFFDIPRKKLHLLLQLAVFVFIYVFIGIRYTPVVMFYTLALGLWAVISKRPSSILVFIGLLLVTLDFNIGFVIQLGFNTGFYPDFIFVFLALLSISRQVSRQEKELQHVQLHNARLEADLLKKNIQPHFLMNTLLTIISLIKTHPEKAIELIRALADEFRIINKISSERTIRIDKEVELCQRHLQIMGLRKSAHYELVVNELDGAAMVPPMLFHTLIENGITHAYEAYESGTFYLSGKKENGYTRYTLKNTVGNEHTADDNKGLEEGMGLKYVRARLEESFSGKWGLDYGRENGNWYVNIELRGE